MPDIARYFGVIPERDSTEMYKRKQEAQKCAAVSDQKRLLEPHITVTIERRFRTSDTK